MSATEFHAEEIRVDRMSVSPSVWAECVAACSDPEGYRDDTKCYVEATVEVEALLDEGGVDWNLEGIVLRETGERVLNGTPLYRALSTAIHSQCAESICDFIADEEGVCWRQETPWHGGWRQA